MNTTGIGGANIQNWTGGPFNGPSIYNAYFNRTDSVRGSYVDGVEVTTEEVYTTGMDTPQQFRIMANRGNTGSISGILAEMVIVEDQSLETRQLIEGYLKWKWNLPALPVGHPYEFAAPTIAVGAGGTFDSLTDTPASKTGFGYFAPFVNEAETDLEYRKVQSELTADLNLTVDFSAGAEVPGVTYLTTQAAWDYQAQFKSDSAETFTVTITTINCASLTDMADMSLTVLSGAWSHVTMFWPGTQVCNPAATIFTGTLFNFNNCITPNFDGRAQSMDLDLSNRVRRTMSFAFTTAKFFGSNNTTDAFVIRNATYSTVGGANDVAVRARNFSTVAADFLWVLGNNNRGASCDESLMSLNNAKLLGRQYGFYADATSIAAAINGPSFDDGSTLVPDGGSVDVFIASGAVANFATAVWSGVRDETNLLATINIPIPEGVVYNNDFPNLKAILDSKVDV